MYSACELHLHSIDSYTRRFKFESKMVISQTLYHTLINIQWALK